jgi:hypothetical protein
LSHATENTFSNQLLKQAKVQGKGRMTYFGFHIYDATFYRSHNPNQPFFALQIHYQKSFSGIAIAKSTEDEMKKVGVPDAQASIWGKELSQIFPNITSGENLLAIYDPSLGTRFFYNDRDIGRVSGPDFAKAFFAIWLDPKTSEPKLRRELLGKDCPPPLITEAC